MCPRYGQSPRMPFCPSDPSSFTHCLNKEAIPQWDCMNEEEVVYGRCCPTWMLVLLAPGFTLLVAPVSPPALVILNEAMMLAFCDIAPLYVLLGFLEFLIFSMFLKVENGLISKEKVQMHLPLRMEVTLVMN